MEIAAVEILKLAVPLVGGGAMGAVITAALARRARRAKKVAIEIDVKPLLPRKIDGKALDVEVTLTIRGKSVQGANLFVGDVRIWNTTGEDLQEYPFHVKLHGQDRLVIWDAKGKDAAHQITQTKHDRERDSEHITFQCEPFLSGDRFDLQLFIEVPNGRTEAGPLEFSTRNRHQFASSGNLVRSQRQNRSLEIPSLNS